MSKRQVIASKDLYNIEEWGAEYFSIDNHGHVVCTPQHDTQVSISMPAILEQAKERGIATPLIIRFPQIINSQLQKMHQAFAGAIKEFHYEGAHLGVFPFKVNQRKEFVDTIVACGKSMDWGLEVGSKAELLAALSYQLSPRALLICNGFKDRHFIEIAFEACYLGKNLVLVVEGIQELRCLLSFLRTRNPTKFPKLGLRVRLSSKGSGKWEHSSGENSKFGLTSTELLHALDLINKAGLGGTLSMLHFHIGSQITAIKRFKNALREAARIYAKVRKLGFYLQSLNIGGGIGVDYDGSHTSSQSSANYNLPEFANDAVYVIGEVCRNEGVTSPDIVTESGRIIAAYHSVVVTDIREVQGGSEIVPAQTLPAKHKKSCHKGICELEYTLENINSKNYTEFYHDSLEYHDDLLALFNLGYLSLEERAYAEDLYQRISNRALVYASTQNHIPQEFAALEQLKIAKYLANFSIFQSIPDSWSVGQLFPVVPLARHNEHTTCKATIVDITCDSDGCLDHFIDPSTNRRSLDLHKTDGKPYYLGFFLVGAYQESLASEHNLFGPVHEVEVTSSPNGSWSISKVTIGESIKKLLCCRNFSDELIKNRYKCQIDESVNEGRISEKEASISLEKFSNYLDGYPYLGEE